MPAPLQSVDALHIDTLRPRKRATVFTSCARNSALHSSRRGILRVFKGASQLLETKRLIFAPDSSFSTLAGDCGRRLPPDFWMLHCNSSPRRSSAIGTFRCHNDRMKERVMPHSTLLTRRPATGLDLVPGAQTLEAPSLLITGFSLRPTPIARKTSQEDRS
ncbi:hypothetical protein KM043_018770 [Ampulex compressa]|nr:hypothetical protein KM043_018770 [Ampulex compressa]